MSSVNEQAEISHELKVNAHVCSEDYGRKQLADSDARLRAVQKIAESVVPHYLQQ